MKKIFIILTLSCLISTSYAQARLGQSPEDIKKEMRILPIKDSLDWKDRVFLTLVIPTGRFVYGFDWYRVCNSTTYYPTKELLEHFTNTYNENAIVLAPNDWVLDYGDGVKVSVKKLKDFKDNEYLFYTFVK